MMQRPTRLLAGVRSATVGAALAIGAPAWAQSNSCSSATVIAPGVYSGTTVGFSRDGTGSCDFHTSGGDVWYRLTAPFAGLLRADTCAGANFDTIISIHTGCPGNVNNEVACSDDSCGSSAAVALSVQAAVTYFIRVAGFNGQSGDFTLTVRLDDQLPDAQSGELHAMIQGARVGDAVGCSVDSPLCNAGTAPLDTLGNPDPRHPFFAWNMYRLKAGRMEQVGKSWAKHMLGAGQGNDCSLGCTPSAGFTHLGIGCSDTYDTGFNSNQAYYGPRAEINSWSGAFTYAGSTAQLGTPPANSIERLLQIRDADLAPAQNPGAQYYCEFIIVCHDDTRHLNNISHELVAASGSPGGTWNFNLAPTATVLGPAIEAWTGATRTTIPQVPAGDGRCILGVKVTDNGNGTWRYDYALCNYDMDRGVQSFSLPVGSATAVSNVGFGAPASHGERYTNDPWTPVRQGTTLTWATAPFSADPATNPIRWGTMYNFWFDADRPPVTSTATLGLYKPGVPGSLSGPAQAPAVPCRADANGDGFADPADVATFIQSWFAGVSDGTAAGDWDASGVTDPADVASYVQVWYTAVSDGC